MQEFQVGLLYFSPVKAHIFLPARLKKKLILDRIRYSPPDGLTILTPPYFIAHLFR